MLVGGMIIYEIWAGVLTTLSISTQARWAVLPILQKNVEACRSRVGHLVETVETFIMECNLEKGMYRSIMVRGTQEDLQNLATWARMLMERTIAMIDRRFPSEEGGLLWSASLFDRRTWPLTDMKFAIQEVEMKLQGIKRNFSIITGIGTARGFICCSCTKGDT